MIRIIGQRWEVCAAQFLRTREVTTIASNVRSRFGEIDLVALDGDTLVFIEVKFRATSRFGPASFSVTKRQQRRIALTADVFRSQHVEYCHWHCRFDIIGFDQSEGQIRLTWLQAAFYNTE
ncbi:MAG: YraN family protein [Proteobacteria bacterium]|nr:MAG: YraN family protein [Pseudomonadota bacterium]